MKKVFTTLAIFMCMICGSVFLVSCSNNYKNMYLVVEYAVPNAEGGVEWIEVGANTSFDYVLSDSVKEGDNYVLYLRVQVKGTSKNVDSLFVSKSVNNSTDLESSVVKPNEAFKVIITNIGSVRFSIIPSEGGADKSISFGVNIYEELVDIAQNEDCIPALVTGGNVKLNQLDDLITYYPLDKTNQTGVSYEINAIGILRPKENNDSETAINNLEFVANNVYNLSDDKQSILNGNNTVANLSVVGNDLFLNVAVDSIYGLSKQNNVIQLKATSNYKPELQTYVYVYVVENFTQESLLISYDNDIQLNNGVIPSTDVNEVGDTIEIFDTELDEEYRSTSIYTYTSESIYSFLSEPGMRLRVYVDGVEYDYINEFEDNLGIKISKADDSSQTVNSVGLNIEAIRSSSYTIKLVIDFEAFDFSASDKSPVTVLSKEIKVIVKSLASSVSINDRTYQDNLGGDAEYVKNLDGDGTAQLYSYYNDSVIGLPIKIQAVPTNAINPIVYVSFYSSNELENGHLNEENRLTNLVLMYARNWSLVPNQDGKFEVSNSNRLYLKFTDDANITNLSTVYMVCEVVSSPDSFEGEIQEVKYKTVVVKFDVIGTVRNIYIYNNTTISNADTLNNEYLENNQTNIGYIHLNAGASGINIDANRVSIKSEKGLIKFSADGTNWQDEITAGALNRENGLYKLYFKTFQTGEDSIIINSPNGVNKQKPYKFVNVTSSESNVRVDFDNTYITNVGEYELGERDIVELNGVEVELRYLALQSGKMVDFVASGDNLNNRIANVQAQRLRGSDKIYNQLYANNTIPTFDSSAVTIQIFNDYTFNVNANTVGRTAIVFVEVNFYIYNIQTQQIELASKYFLYEIAVYIQAQDLNVQNKNEILYINSNYLDVATVTFNISLNGNLTQNIYFSSQTTNDAINIDYGDGYSSIYGVLIDKSESLDSINNGATENNEPPYFDVSGLEEYGGEWYLNRLNRVFEVQALRDLQTSQHTYFYIDIIVYQFGSPTTYTQRKIIYFGDYIASGSIVVDGVDIYKNLYLSLLNEGLSTKTIKTKVSNSEASFTDIDYMLYSFNTEDKSTQIYSGTAISIQHELGEDEFIISATAGGTYILELFTRDSYNESTSQYENSVKIMITVSDGNSESTAYLISNLEEFKYMTTNNENKYYRLANDINISTLDWWNEVRIFKGNLDGAITIYNPNNNSEIRKQYSLIGLNIQKGVSDSVGFYFGLFASNEGSIKNVVFDRVSFNIELTSSNTASGNPVNIGIIAGVNYGVIENCSVRILDSKILLTTGASNTSYNIGLIAGANFDTIKYDNTQGVGNYIYMMDCYSSGKLLVEVASGNSNYGSNTNIYIGGIAGQNNQGEISSTYIDNSSQALNTTITGVVNIELKVGDNSQNPLMNIQDIALGGAVGYNLAKLHNVAISGKLVSYDKVSMGGIVGINNADLQECSNMGMVLEGRTLSTFIPQNGGKLVYFADKQEANDVLLEQNIGGIVGYNKGGKVDNVRVLFITFESSEVSVENNNSYILGVGNIGGIIGKAYNTSLTRAYIENFVSFDNYYNFIAIDANIGGFIGEVEEEIETSVILGFVQANFDIGTSVFYEFGNDLNYEYVYFIGDVAVDNSIISITGSEEEGNLKVSLIRFNDVYAGSSYIVENIIYENKTKQFLNSVGVEEIVLNSTEDVTGYKIQWIQQSSINSGYPYLIYIQDGVEVSTITIQPQEIIVDVDEDYFEEGSSYDGECFEIYNNGIYVQYTLNEEISSTAIVYFNVAGNNTHTLVSDMQNGVIGLIEKTILPSLANGRYSVRIVSGMQIATITGNNITFSGIGRVELEFTSMYNNDVKDTVVIFIENKLAEDVFDVDLSHTGTIINEIAENEYSTYLGSNAFINVGLNSVDDATFDGNKMYVKFTVTDENGNSVDDYVSVKALTNNMGGLGTALGVYEFATNSLPSDQEFMRIKITFEIYLYLDAFNITDQLSLQDLTSDLQTFIAEKTIYITVYNSATDLQIVSTDASVPSGSSVDIDSILTTGWGKEADDSIKYAQTKLIGGRFHIEVSNKDSINMQLVASNNNASELVKQVSNIWELFKTEVSYRYIDGKYNYNILIELKDEYKALTAQCDFALTIYANTNNNYFDTVNISFVPQKLTTFRMEHYANLAVRVGSDNASIEAEYVSSESQSALIIPGYSGLMKIYAEPSYAYCENISITSSRVTINGREYFIRYQQMVYDEVKDVYVSLPGITAEGESLSLVKRSYIDENGYSYNGVIFVRTILENVVGVRQLFTSTISATTYDIDGNEITVSQDKVLLSQYKPGVDISVSNTITTVNNGAQVYLVEKGSSSAIITARVYGYELDIKPTYKTSWVDGNQQGTAEYVGLVEQGDVVQGEDGAYYIQYALNINSACDRAFKINFKMTLDENGNELTSHSETLTFYPIDYLVNSVSVNGVANGILDIGIDSSWNLSLDWTTMKPISQDRIDQINEKVYSDLDENFLKLFYVQEFNPQTNIYENRYFDKFLKTESEETTDPFKIISNGDGTYRIKAISRASRQVFVTIYYGYIFNEETGLYEIKFSNVSTEGITNRLTYSFTLMLSVETSEDAPRPLYQSNFTSMVAGENYILMEDIVLTNWQPLSTEIASLDGNNKIITIESFDIGVAGSVNAGLFAVIGEDTIIKNLTIDISSLDNQIFINDENTTNVNINFGILAGENRGLIYNCEIISLQDKKVELIIGNSYNLVFGSLVGLNSGSITNSRVGTEYFERLYFDRASTVLRCGDIEFESSGVMAGFVGNNTGIVSSSYVANTSIENSSNNGNDEYNMTAGFVAVNSGEIAYSYVKGSEESILSTRARATGAEIYASGAGSVAGFVFNNSGTIHDSYSNIICKSNSAVVSGFVYNNMVNGNIYQCYSASTVLSESEDSAMATELPFVGIGINKNGAQVLLQDGTLKNSYYLDDGTEYDTNYLLPSESVDLPIPLTLEAFSSSSNLNNYAFIEGEGSNYNLNAVWTYSTAIDSNKQIYTLGLTSLPELTSANQIARSVRRLTREDGDANYNYEYLANYQLGTINNPDIIRNTDEYRSVLIGDSSSNVKVKSGYFRLINNIDFGSTINIETKSNFVLGDRGDNQGSLRNLTVFDGNGMTISGVSISYSDSIDSAVNSIGLFSEVYYAIIKGLNVEFSTSIGSSQATYSGGIAGFAQDSYFIDLNLTGGIDLNLTGGMEVRAKNVAGGVVGLISGEKSGLFNVSSNLSATAGLIGSYNRYTSDMLQSNAISTISYAGGIAGIIDIGKADENININRVVINDAKIVADKSGGIAGYLGKNVNAQRLQFVIGSNSQINGSEVAGGLIGENFGKIALSQIGAEQSSQETIDQAFAQYINSNQDESLNNTNYGNLNVVIGGSGTNSSVGGLIGINYGGDVENSLTKASIGQSSSRYSGGLIGINYGGNLSYVYAQNYIDIANKGYVGGLYGYLGNITLLPVESDISDISTTVGIDNVVIASMFDKTQLNNLTSGQRNIDYIVGRVDNDVEIYLSEYDKSNPVLHYGVFNPDTDNPSQYKDGKIANKNLQQNGSFVATHYDMNSLYDLQSETQKEIFEELFILWDVNYWDLDNTKYMPVLKEDNSISFIPISTSSDINKITQHPDANFILMNDVEVGVRNSNYVANVNFTGVLIGRLQSDGSYPKFTNITLNARTANSVTSGFFRQTTDARISNVGFEYTNLNLSGGNYTYVGGVSANDDGSRFEQVIVTSNNSGSITTSTNASVTYIGTIIGGGNNSTLIASSSSLPITVRSSLNSYIGGLIGSVNGTGTTGDTLFNSLISSSQYNANITVLGDNNSVVGGLVGSSTYTTISGSKSNIASISVESQNATIGGLVGETNNSLISSSNAVLTEITANKEDGVKYVGGLIGRSLIDNMDNSVSNSYATLNINDIKAESLYIGGIIADASQKVKLNNVASEMTYTSSNSNAQYINIGGIIGSARSGAIIDSAMAYMNNCQVHYNTRLIAGGLIAQVSGDDYEIYNSSSIGKIFAESNNQGILTILGGMVGYVGTIAENNLNPISIQGTIENSYSALTIISDSVYRGRYQDGNTEYSNSIYDRAIVGYNNSTNVINITDVLYSSDYTLTVDDDENKFTNKPINVTANTLLYSVNISNVAEELNGSEVLTGANWIRKDGQLPFNSNLQNILLEMKILVAGNDNEVNYRGQGEAFNPIVINKNNYYSNLNNASQYNYYTLSPEIEIAQTINKFTGLILGNNVTIKGSVEFIEQLNKGSAISNITFELSGSPSSLVITNSGTIFMCNVDYNDVNSEDMTIGGISRGNYGRIAYCGVTGNITVGTQATGGIVWSNGNAENTTASIEYSYSTASINGSSNNSTQSNIAAMAYYNYGYIGNSYVAGVTNSALNVSGNEFVVTHGTEARYENNYFDYYAQFIKEEDYENRYQGENGIAGITGISTKDLQNLTGLSNGWISYGILNPNISNSATYNYGYPIYNFNQYALQNDSVALGEIKAKFTGDGTFNNSNNKAYLINTIGVLWQIDALENSEGKYFELVNDINLPNDIDENAYKEDENDKLISAWKGIGNTNVFKGIFTSSSDSEELSTDFTDVNILVNDEAKIISNLHGEALFKNVDGAVIANITLQDSYVISSSLINTIQSSSTGDGKIQSTRLYNISINGTITSASQGNVSGLINNVGVIDDIGSQPAKLEMYQVDLGSGGIVIQAENSQYNVNGAINNITAGSEVLIKQSFQNTDIDLQGGNNSNLSGFVGNNDGVITFNDPSNIWVKSLGTSTIKSVSGFVNTNQGQIVGGGTEVFIDTIASTDYTTSESMISGLVANMQSGAISGFNIEFVSIAEDEYVAEIFGGVAGRLTGGVLGARGDITEGFTPSDEDKISVKLTTASSEIYGGVAAIALGGAIANVSINSGDKITVKAYDQGLTPRAYGLIIGQYGTSSDSGISGESLDLINYTLESNITFEVLNGANVGGIIGQAYIGEFSFMENIPAQDIIVKGARNVGGFIGQYLGEESLRVNTEWIVQGQYAEIEATSRSNNGWSNFGGLFGQWNTTAELKAVDSEGETIIIINSNEVLNTNIDIFNSSITDNEREVLTGVGGVVGNTIGNVTNAVNIAQIGYVNTTQIDEYDVIEQNNLKNYYYVGGIVGTSEQQIILTDCANLGAIYGYGGVGGLIGFAENVSITATVQEDEYQELRNVAIEMGLGSTLAGENVEGSAENLIISGFSDVGGLVGRASSISITNAKLSTNVIGYVNIGGFVGYVSGGVEIENGIVMSANINGNFNVGGLAGYVAENTEILTRSINNVIVGAETDSPTTKNTTICGIIYETSITNNQNQTTNYYFLPSNMGGVVGYGEDIAFNKVSSISIITSLQDYETDIKDANTSDTKLNVSLVSNYIATTAGVNTEDITRLDYTQNIYLEADSSPRDVRYEVVDSGIGGFAGYAQNLTFIDSNSYSDVYAYYGINVGGVFGNLVMGEGASLSLPELPKGVESVNVAGKLFVGGYIGKVNQLALINNDSTIFDNNGNINVQLLENQSIMAGNCIGGVIGYCQNDLSGLVIQSDVIAIKLYNSTSSTMDSSYVGGIVGRLDGSMANCKLSAIQCGAVLVTPDSPNSGFLINSAPDNETHFAYADLDGKLGIIQSPDIYNYGGLVGLLYVKANATVSVKGEHYYAFTVDMVQNQDYQQGRTEYNYSSAENEQTLTAIAHYVNMSNITISASALTDLYDGRIMEKDSAGNISRDGGGDYTYDHNPTNPLAQGWAREYTMFRMMSRVIPQPNEPTGDSVQVLYSADYITEVKILGYSQANNNGPSIANNLIQYTIYQPINQSAMLYSRYGIAFEVASAPENLGTATDPDTENVEYKFDSNKSDARENMYKHVEDANEKNTTSKITPGYTYYNSASYLCLDGGRWFRFDVVFGYGDNINEDLHSKSGSLFEVTGTAVDVDYIAPEEGENLPWYVNGIFTVLGGIATVAGVIILVSNPATLTLGFIGLGLAFFGSMSFAGGGTGLIQNYHQSQLTAYAVYSGIEGASYGAMYSNYVRDITYTNGELDITPDSYVSIEVPVQFKIAEGMQEEMLNFILTYLKSDEGIKGLQDLADKYSENVYYDELNNTVTLYLAMPYYAFSNSNVSPNIANEQLVIDKNTENEELKNNFFDPSGAESISFPKFIKVDNEIYISPFTGEFGKKLYQNYSDFSPTELGEFEITPAQYTDYQGYLYTYAGDQSGYQNWKAETQQYFTSTYQVSPSITTTKTYNIIRNKVPLPDKDNDGYVVELINNGTLYWQIVDSIHPQLDQFKSWTNGLVQTTTEEVTNYSNVDPKIKYEWENGELKETEEAGKGRDNIQLYYNLGGNSYEYFAKNYYSNNQDATFDDLKAAMGQYYTAEEAGEENDLNLTLVEVYANVTTQKVEYTWSAIDPSSGLKFTSGEYNKFKVDGYYYYEFNAAGTISIPRTYYITQRYKYSQIDGGGASILTPITSVKITVYNSEFSNGTTITLDADTYDSYKNFYLVKLSDELYGSKLSEVYLLIDGQLYLKEVIDLRFDEKGFIYSSVTNNSYDGETRYYNFNKYVYNTNISDSSFKFYTRYRYEAQDNTFIDKSFALGDEGDSREISIKTILFPENSSYTSLNQTTTFIESVRVTLSGGNAKIYTNFEENATIDNAGTITVDWW